MAWSEKAKAGGSGAVEGEIIDYTFMDVFPFGEDQEPDGNIYLLLEIMPEGAEEATKRSLYLGSGKYLVIEEDGKVLRSGEDGVVDEEGTPKLYDKGEVCKFIDSLEEAGFPAESRFPDPAESKTLDFRGMIGTRIRLVNETDVEATKEFGKRKVKKGKHKGKEFNRTFNKVTKVLSLPDEKGAKKGAKAAPATAKKTAKAEVEEEEVTTSEITDKAADKFLKGLLTAAPENTLLLKGLSIAVTRYAAKQKMDEGDRDNMLAKVKDTEYLTEAAERGLITFNAKKGIVSLDA